MKTADFVQDNNTYLRVTGHIQLAHRGTKAKAPPSRHPLTWLGETEPRHLPMSECYLIADSLGVRPLH
jgi:hypothetical protein